MAWLAIVLLLRPMASGTRGGSHGDASRYTQGFLRLYGPSMNVPIPDSSPAAKSRWPGWAFALVATVVFPTVFSAGCHFRCDDDDYYDDDDCRHDDDDDNRIASRLAPDGEGGFRLRQYVVAPGEDVDEKLAVVLKDIRGINLFTAEPASAAASQPANQLASPPSAGSSGSPVVSTVSRFQWFTRTLIDANRDVLTWPDSRRVVLDDVEFHPEGFRVLWRVESLSADAAEAGSVVVEWSTVPAAYLRFEFDIAGNLSTIVNAASR